MWYTIMIFNLFWEGGAMIRHPFSQQMGKPYKFVSSSLFSLWLKALF